MKITGKLKDIQLSLEGKPLLILEVNEKESLISNANKLNDILLDIEVKKHMKKRSLNANSYFHVLCDKIAKASGTTQVRVKNELIRDYGFLDKDEDGNINHIIMRDDIDYLDSEYLHLRPTQKIQILDNGELYRVYMILRGSHTYNTSEMAHLIDATIEEAKALDIDVITREQKERMLSAWRERYESDSKS